MIQRQVSHMHSSVDHRRIERARSLQSKVSASLQQQRIKLNLVNTRQVEVLPLKVEAEAMRRRCIPRAAVDNRILMREMNMVQSSLAFGETEVCIERLNSFTIDRRVRSVDVSLGLRMCARSIDLQRQ